MSLKSFSRIVRTSGCALALFVSAHVGAALTDISTAPIITTQGSGVPVRPNIMFVIDDSGSMDWDYLPDWSNDYYCKRTNGTVRISNSVDDNGVNSLCCRNRSSGSDACMYGTSYANTGSGARRMDVPMATSDFNSAYYNPAITYTPPRNADGSSKPSQDCTTSGGVVSGTACTGGWASVKLDAFEVQESSSTTLNLLTRYPDVEWCSDTNYTDCRKNSNYFYPNSVYRYFQGAVGLPYYYLIIPGEYCTNDKLTSCVAASAPSSTYPIAAPLRWCSDKALTTCQGIKNATYQYPRYPALMAGDGNSGSVTTVVTVSGNPTPTNNKLLTVNSFTVATGPALISGATAASNDVAIAAQNLVANLANGYSASEVTCSTSGSTRSCMFTVLAPSSGTCPSGAFSISTSQGLGGATSITVAASPQFTACRTPGAFVRVNIDPAVNSYPYPGTTQKHPSRTDCSATSGPCTYLEEMTNFANWFTYYRTRMQMMKSASSIAFQGLSDSYRVGYLSLNNSGGGRFLNINTFNTTQRSDWYAKLFSTNPSGSTPLRSALSTAGLIYGGSLNGESLNGSTVVDPVQYSCQQNFTILSTDGYWNTGNDSGCSGRGGEGCQLDRTSAVGNTDGVAGRPYSDGAAYTVTEVTPMTLVERKEYVQTRRTTTPWTRTVVTNGAACSVPLGAAGSCRQDTGGDDNSSGNRRTWCLRSSTAGMDQFNECRALGTTPEIYACRGQNNATNLPGGSSAGNFGCLTASDGKEWCLYPNGSQPNTSTCRDVHSNNPLRACVRDYAAGTSVTTTPQTYNQIADVSRATVQDETSTYNRTVVRTNGVVTSDTNSTPTVSTAVVSTAETPVSDSGAPGGGTTWTSGTATTTCMQTPTAPGTSAAVAGSPTTASVGSAAVTTQQTTGPTAGTTVVTSSTTSGGTSDSLADVAYYYYETDLRPAGSQNAVTGVDVGTGEYDAGTGTYKNSVQRMVTYTLGLGIDGFMKFDPAYATRGSGDYEDIRTSATATTASATNPKCTWQASGTTCNWPTPSSDSQANIDDLWHAAVNGRGTYYSAGTPAALAAGLSNALANITAKEGAAAAATTSNPNITAGDNFLFSSDFKSSEWYSRLQRLQIDPASGQIVEESGAPKVDWNAHILLQSKVGATSDTRTIYTFSSDTATYANQLKPFNWASLTTTERDFFQGAAVASLPQFCATGTYGVSGEANQRICLTTAQQTDAAGEKLVNFLRGQTGYEDRQANTDASRPIYYRIRTYPLGDIVSSEAVYVKKPLFSYTDTGFAAFRTSQEANSGMVYVAANDGMLHAFDADSGVERWAYVPSMVLPRLFRLASMSYKNSHQFFVDGTPVVDYAYFDGAWHTLLIGGLGAGGSGYYALDITDPLAPKALWEFKPKTTGCAATLADAIGQTADCDLGYSYGNPVVTKLADGTWVVMVTSGYNNTTPGDGKGYLYILDPESGEIIRKIGTGVGSNSTIAGVCSAAPCPSGLAKISAWVDAPSTNNTARRVYGGDLFGNLWRFDVNDNLGASGYEAQELIVLNGPAGNRQPITARPELGESNGIPLVLIGTGRYLGDSDKADPLQASSPTNNRQSFYGIKDPLTASSWGDSRAAGLVAQTVTVNASTQERTVTGNSVPLATVPGWYVDLPDNGERSFTDPALALGTVVFTTGAPLGDACSSAGQSFIYNLDFRSGAPVAGVGGRKLGNAMATRPVIVQLQGGAIRSITKLGDTTTDVRDVSIGSGNTNPRRVSWRQLFDQ